MGSNIYQWEATDAVFESMSNKPWWGKSCIINYALHKGFEPENRESLRNGLPNDPYNTLARRFEKCHLPRYHGKPQTTGQGHLDWLSVEGLVDELEDSGEAACDIAAAVKNCLPRDSTNPKYMQIMKEYLRRRNSTSNEECGQGQADGLIQPTMSSGTTAESMTDNIRKSMLAQKSHTLAVSRPSTPSLFSQGPDMAEMPLYLLNDSQPESHTQQGPLPRTTPPYGSLPGSAPGFGGYSPDIPGYFPNSASSESTWPFQSPDLEAVTNGTPSHAAHHDWNQYYIGGLCMTKEEIENNVISRFQDRTCRKPI